MKKLNVLYYMTQYADYMTDEGYYDSMSNQVKTLDGELLRELMDLAPSVSDRFNRVLFDLLFTIDNEQLQELVEVWEYLADNDIEEALGLLSIDVMDLFTGDSYLYDFETLEEMADNDLRANGVNANALYWYKELEKNSGYNYYMFNGYFNGFYYYDNLIDAVDEHITFEVIADKIKEYFN